MTNKAYTIKNIFKCSIKVDYKRNAFLEEKKSTPLQKVSNFVQKLTLPENLLLVERLDLIKTSQGGVYRVMCLDIESTNEEDVDKVAKQIVEYINTFPTIEIIE